jgi:hypothetical protein
MISPATVVRYADRLDEVDANWLLGKGCVLWYRGKTETDFPISPDGVTATPAGTWANDLTLNNGRKVKTFNGSTNYISLSDHASWAMFEGNLTITGWIYFGSVASAGRIIGQAVDVNTRWNLSWAISSNILAIYGIVSSTVTFQYSYPFVPTINTWYYITVVKSGSSCVMYLNAVPQTVTITQAWRNTTDIAAGLNIGRVWVSSWEYTNANIKDLMIIKGTALSAAEINYIYNTTKKYLVH